MWFVITLLSLPELQCHPLIQIDLRHQLPSHPQLQFRLRLQLLQLQQMEHLRFGDIPVQQVHLQLQQLLTCRLLLKLP